jgi:Na+-driven multidrug efflux pump
VVEYCYSYIIVYIPGIFLFGLSEIQRRFLNNFGKSDIAFYTGVIGGVAHIGFCYIFVIKMNLGVVGIGYAMGST